MVDGATAGHTNDPAQRLALVRIEVGSAVPDLHEHILERLLGVGFVGQDFQDDLADQRSVAGVEIVERAGLTGLDAGHEGFVIGDGRCEVGRGSGFRGCLHAAVVVKAEKSGATSEPVSCRPAADRAIGPKAVRKVVRRPNLLSGKTPI